MKKISFLLFRVVLMNIIEIYTKNQFVFCMACDAKKDHIHENLIHVNILIKLIALRANLFKNAAKNYCYFV